MIAWSIAAAQESDCFDHVLVSTDDTEIADIARANGADVPFMRPDALADDHTPTLPVIQHALAEATRLWESPQAACCIYATAPFLRADDLRSGMQGLANAGDNFVLSVTSFSFPIQRALLRDDAGRLAMMQPEHAGTRSQDLPEAWHDAGQFYWGNASAWQSGRPILFEGAIGIPLPRSRVQDIDTEEDWSFAEMLFEQQKPAK